MHVTDLWALDRVVVVVLVLLGIGAGTVLPIMRAKARTGATGLTFQQPRRDLYERTIGTIVGLLGAAHLAWAPLYLFLGPSPLGVHLGGPALFWGGVLVYLCALALVVSAQRTMGRAWRIGIDTGTTSLVREGVYSWVRNPIYVGAIGCAVGMLMVTPSWLTAAGAIGYLFFIQLQVRLEERHLLALHGASYRDFLDSVGRFIPLPSRALGDRERETLVRFAEAVIPAGTRVPGAGTETLASIERQLVAAPASTGRAIRLLLIALEHAPRLTNDVPFSELDSAAREARIARWLRTAPGLARHAIRALVAIVKTSHFDDPAVAAAIDTRTYAPVAAERPPWRAQIRDGVDVTRDETIETDVVVVGTGAGGAVVAYELAARGHAVVMIEEGRYFDRTDFVGRASEARAKMFRDGGQTLSMGNVLVPIWTGVTVGGSTTINSGTCYRTPDRILARWRNELGLDALTVEAMAPHFARVERILGVAPTEPQHLGGGARAIESGLASLRWKSEPIPRNAPGCDGQGRCMFGCPTGAKRSTDTSYVPMALEKGAVLYAQTKAVRVLLADGVASGLEARTAAGARLTVRSKITVLAGGALMTPVFLRENGLANRSGMVGENLSIHPAAPVLALFDHPIEMQKNVPQSWAVEELAEHGVMIEESGNPPEVVAVALPLVGRGFVDAMARHERLSAFGIMIEDTSRGRVVPGRGGRPSITYSMNGTDVQRMQRGTEALVELFLASGAREVFPALRQIDRITDRVGLERLRGERLDASDFALSAVHPLGTARMGIDARTSVVDMDHQTHDVRGLFVVDGSAVPTALGVNPQITIMAMATRAAACIHERL